MQIEQAEAEGTQELKESMRRAMRRVHLFLKLSLMGGLQLPPHLLHLRQHVLLVRRRLVHFLLQCTMRRVSSC